MQKYIIEGGHELCGTVRVSGSKNAALPVIFATLITHGISEIQGLPEIEDVRVALKLIEGFGAVITRVADITYIDTRALYYTPPCAELVGRLRASTYLIGACLARFGEALTGGFGGCSFSDRPIDMHISAMLSLGAYMVGDKLIADRLFPSEISFRLSSVGATVNALIASASIEGESVITLLILGFKKIGGSFIIKSISPVGKPKIKFSIAAIPVTPPGEILFGSIKKQKPNA